MVHSNIVRFKLKGRIIFLDQNNPEHVSTEHPITMRPIKLDPEFQKRIGAFGAYMINFLNIEYGIIAAFTGFDNQWWIRLSCQAYTPKEDFDRLAEKMEYLLNEVKKEDIYEHTLPYNFLNTGSPVISVNKKLSNFRSRFLDLETDISQYYLI